MHSALLESLAHGVGDAGAICFVAAAVSLRFMRVKANAVLAPGHRIRWWTDWRQVIASYRRLYPQGWAYPVLRAATITWLALFGLLLIIIFLGMRT